MVNAIKAAIKRLPVLRKIVAERDSLREARAALQSALEAQDEELVTLRSQIAERDEALRTLGDELGLLKQNPQFVPPGHYYSPIPAVDEIRRDESQIYGNIPRSIAGLELHEAEQLALLQDFVAYYDEMPFQAEQAAGLRYYFENRSYGYSDGILLHCMIRFLKPRRIIEVGSGFSSCMTLDTNERYFGGVIETTFIEPYPELLESLLTEADAKNTRLIQTRLQDVDLSEFDVLRSNDILFIDSTHVSKINSDVNRLFFEILPRLATGVHIHFHDICFPFEYPPDWIYEGRAWNEAYTLRAFLQYNSSFRVVLMNTFMERFHESFFKEKMPLCLKNAGSSIWLRRE